MPDFLPSNDPRRSTDVAVFFTFDRILILGPSWRKSCTVVDGGAGGAYEAKGVRQSTRLAVFVRPVLSHELAGAGGSGFIS